MKFPTYIIWILIFSNIFLACSKTEKVEQPKEIEEIVVFNDGYKATKNGELVKVEKLSTGVRIATTKEQRDEGNKNGKYGSEVKTMYDGYGNKTVSRFFYDHPLIAGTVTKTSSKGETKIFVYSKDGKVKTLASNYRDLVLNATADEIAINANIKAVVKENEDNKEILLAEAIKADDIIKPMPVNDFPIDNFETVSDEPEVNEVVEKTEKQVEKVAVKKEKIADTTYLEQFEKNKQLAKKNSQKNTTVKSDIKK